MEDLREHSGVSLDWRGEGLFRAVSLGFWFVLVGFIFLSTPHLFSRTLDFIGDFQIVRVPDTSVFLPAPAHPGGHTTVYDAVWEYTLIWGIFQIVILASRFALHSSTSRKAETASSVVFMLGSNYLVGEFLNSATTLERWFLFWAAIIMLIGVSLLARAAFMAFRA